MNDVLNFLWEARYGIVLASGIIVSAIVSGNKTQTKELVSEKIKQAEQMVKYKVLNSKVEVEEWVYNEVKKIVPPKYLSLISDDKLKKIIQDLVSISYDYLDDGIRNYSI